MPDLLVMFLENTIKQVKVQKPAPKIPAPKGEDPDYSKGSKVTFEYFKPKLIPWSQFKSIIFGVLDHRLAHAQEIQGMINTSYVTMSE